MKTFFYVISLIVMGTSQIAWSQNVGINATGALPDASAMLDVAAADKGLLVPRVALTASNVAGPMTSPASSLLVYNTATAGTTPNDVVPGYYYWNGSSWIRLLTSAAPADWSIIGTAGTTPGTNFIGTTDAVDLVFKTNNTERARILSSGNVGIATSTPDYKLDVGGSIRTGRASSTNGSLVFSNSSNTNTVTLNSGVTSSSYGVTLPTVQGDANTVLTNNGSGVLSWNTFSAASGNWSTTGNAGTDDATDFIGTTDDIDLVFKTNNDEALRILSGGGIEANAGTGSGSVSASAFYTSGTYNNYLEINVQNLSNGNLASSDLVATANNGSGSSVYVDLGINSQGYSNGASNILNGGNLAYLYANADNFKIGNGTPNKALIFFTNPSGGTLGTNTANGVERMRIAPSGNVGVNTNTPLSTLDNNGSAGAALVRTASNITLDASHYTVMLHSGTPTVTLPAASTCERRIYVIVNQTGTARAITSYQNFSNSGTTTIAANSSITIQSDGLNWYQIR